MATATQTKAIKGFQVTCPCCGDADSTVKLDLNDLKSMTCDTCDETFSPKEAVAKMAEALRKWEAIARWTEAAGEFLDNES